MSEILKSIKTDLDLMESKGFLAKGDNFMNKIGYGEGIKQAEDVDVFVGFGEGIRKSNDERPDL